MKASLSNKGIEGNDDFCKCYGCKFGEGPCHSDDECMGGMRCGDRNCLSMWNMSSSLRFSLAKSYFKPHHGCCEYKQTLEDEIHDDESLDNNKSYYYDYWR